MPTQALETLLVLLLAVLFLGLLLELGHFDDGPVLPKASRYSRRPLRPRTPDDCPHCRDAAAAVAHPLIDPPVIVVPYPQLKSRRGRTKTIETGGYACPNSDCCFYNNSDPAVHALVGYGHHGSKDRIQDFYCQACHRKFTARRHTALYHLKTPAARVAQVLHALAEGLSLQAAARVFDVPESTVHTWLTRAGMHAQSFQDRTLRALHLTHVQLDELRFKLRGVAEAAWLWIACDAKTKLIPAFALGPRTQTMAHNLVHDLVHRLASDCLPVFSSDGLALYFYALTAHFGDWVQQLGERRRRWVVAAELLYAQVIKRYKRKRIAEVRWQIQLGTLDDYRQTLRALGLTGRIQTAFVERLNLTFRRSIAGLARRSWSLPCSLGELALHFDWWRAYYHFVRPHTALAVQQPVGKDHAGSRQHRTRARTPAQAAGLTDHKWTVLELLTFPAPPLEVGSA